MTVNADFLISPAYIVPTMMISIRWRWTRIAVPDADALGRRVRLERRHVDDREVGGEPREVLRGGSAEQVASEDARPGRLGVDPQRTAMRRVCADEQVLAVQAPIGQVGHQAGAEPVVVLLADGVVHVAPPDVRLARRLADDELVLWRATRVRARRDDERPLGRDQALTVARRCLVQRSGRQVGDDLAGPHSGAGSGRARTGRVGRGRCGHRGSVSCSGVPAWCRAPCFDPTGRA